MTMTLEGSCRCGAVRFRVESHAPQPYQRCYCTICRKTAGGGGYAINLSAVTDTLQVDGREAILRLHAQRRRVPLATDVDLKAGSVIMVEKEKVLAQAAKAKIQIIGF